jgi:hypothetical protein
LSVIVLFTPIYADEIDQRLRPMGINDHAQIFRVELCPGGKAVMLELPESYDVVLHRMVDFDVLNIADRNTSESIGRLLLYIGHAPSPKHPDEAAISKGIVGAFQVKWYSWSENWKTQPAYFRETLVEPYPVPMRRGPNVPLGSPPPPPQPPQPPTQARACEEGITVHVLAAGRLREAIDRMTSSLRLKREQEAGTA